MKTEISLLPALIVLAVYAFGLAMLLLYILQTVWLVTRQADPIIKAMAVLLLGGA